MGNKIQMRNERSRATIMVRNEPAIIDHWKRLGYAIDTDEHRFPKYDVARANNWGAPNCWERTCGRNVNVNKNGQRQQHTH